MLKPSFRMIIAAIAGLAAMPANPARAQEFPNRSIKVIVPYPAGGPTDILARALGDGFRERTGQSFVIENKPGANTSVGAMACKASDPDGYTLCFLASTTLSVNPHLYSDLRYASADLAPVTNIAAAQAAFLLHKSVPANTFAEAVEWSKKNPDKMNYGSFGVGGETHLMAEWLNKQSGMRSTHVPFAGFAPALVALDRGDIQVMFPVVIPPIIERIKKGDVKPILIMGDSKHDLLPDAPTIPQIGLPPVGFTVWFGMFTPAGAPKDRIEKLSAELRAVMANRSFIDKYITAFGMTPVTNTPDAFKAFLAQDYVKAGELVKISGVKLEGQ
jgi:tripartite-type tricarboxylate transporter receptor subunit TctC